MAPGGPMLVGGFDRAYRRMSERQARRLLDDVRRSPERAVPTGERAAAFLVACLVHLATAALVVGGVVLALVTWFDWLAFVGGVILATAGLAVLPRRERPTAGVRLRDVEAPHLRDLVDEISDVLAAPRVDTLVLGVDFNIGVAPSGLRQRRSLVLGLPFWAILDGPERIAVVGHEIGHTVSGDPSTSVVIGAALQTLRQWGAVLRPDRQHHRSSAARAFLAVIDPVLYVLALLPRGAHALLDHLVLRDQQRGEYLSDVFAVQVAGRDATARALEKSLLGPAVDAELERLAGAVATRDTWALLRERAVAVLRADRARLLRDAAAEQARLDATHPPTTMRLELVRSLADEPGLVQRSPWDWSAIDAETAPLAGPLGRAVITRYRELPES